MVPNAMQSTTVAARAPARQIALHALHSCRAALCAYWYPVLLAGVVLAMYAPSIGYGLIWDDPVWYSQGRGQTIWELLVSLPSYQYYRPLAIAVNHLLTSADGVVHAELAHALQVAAHLGGTLALVGVLRGFGLGQWHARLAALLFAVHPFGHQAVAWQAPQQPIATALVLASVLLAQRYAVGRRPRHLIGSALVYTAGLLFQESAAGAAWLFPWVALIDAARRHQGWRRGLRANGWAAIHLLVAGAYVLVWLHVPRSEGVTGKSLEQEVLAYLLQGALYPVARVMGLAGVAWSPAAILAALVAAGALLVTAMWRSHSWPAALLGLAWAATGILPSWAGLRWEYVQIGSRLLYPAIPGVAILWAGLVTRALGWGRAGRLAGALVLGALLAVSAEQYAAQDRLTRIGTDHMRAAVAEMSARPGERLLYVNFPDRLQMRPSPYPLGFWGLTLAPVVQDMGDYAAVSTGVRVQTSSLSVPQLDWDAREASPYRVDLRGVHASAEDLARGAMWAEAVYLTEYGADGTLTLREIGDLVADDGAPAEIIFGRGLELLSWELTPCLAPGCAHLDLLWRATEPLSWGDTLFVHVLTPDGVWVSGADGDALAGALPLVNWPRGWLLRERRVLLTDGLGEGDYAVTVGLYNRDTRERHGARLADGTVVANGEPQVATLHVP